MNSVNLVGNLGRDPNITVSASGLKIARFSIGITRAAASKTGEKQTDWPSIVAFGTLADVVERYTKKGTTVSIEGRIQTGSYEKDGRTVYTTDIVANRIMAIKGRKDAPSEYSGGYNPVSEPLNQGVPQAPYQGSMTPGQQNPYNQGAPQGGAPGAEIPQGQTGQGGGAPTEQSAGAPGEQAPGQSAGTPTEQAPGQVAGAPTEQAPGTENPVPDPFPDQSSNDSELPF